MQKQRDVTYKQLTSLNSYTPKLEDNGNLETKIKINTKKIN